MFSTRITDRFGTELPIVSAGMGGVATASLAAAVSEAGGLGTIALVGYPPEAIADEIAKARAITRKPIAVNFLVPFLRPQHLEALRGQPISAITMFWGDPREQIPAAKSLGVAIIWQCGSAKEAMTAKNAGADAIIAQGFEAGGHVRGVMTTMALVPEVRDAIGELPMLAAGGIMDGRGLASALALGADGAVFGTRFLGAEECAAHPEYRRAVLAAHGTETVHAKLYDIGWPDAAHRVIRTGEYERWERAGCPATGARPGEGEIIAHTRRAGIETALPRYSVNVPTSDTEGDIAAMAHYAGQGVGAVRRIQPAREIVAEIAEQARETIANRLASILQ
jgi:nitronate monooxygenase